MPAPTAADAITLCPQHGDRRKGVVLGAYGDCQRPGPSGRRERGGEPADSPLDDEAEVCKCPAHRLTLLLFEAELRWS